MPDLEPINVGADQEMLFTPPTLMRAPEVCRRAGVTYRQLDYWCRSGLVTPTREARGSGSQREFSEGDLRVVRAVKVLLPLFDHRFTGGRPGERDQDLLDVLDEVRHGDLSMIEVQRGIWYDLAVLCSDDE